MGKEFSTLPTITTRPSLDRHFTVSGVIIAFEQVLLVHHKRIGAWLPPGGHIEAKELPHEAVVREVLEETGIEVEVLSTKLPDTGDPNAFFLPTPLCLHAVHAFEGGEHVYHVDLAYLCRPIVKEKPALPMQLPIASGSEEVHDARWLPLADLGQLPLAKNVREILQLAQASLR